MVVVAILVGVSSVVRGLGSVSAITVSVHMRLDVSFLDRLLVGVVVLAVNVLSLIAIAVFRFGLAVAILTSRGIARAVAAVLAGAGTAVAVMAIMAVVAMASGAGVLAVVAGTAVAVVAGMAIVAMAAGVTIAAGAAVLAVAAGVGVAFIALVSRVG